MWPYIAGSTKTIRALVSSVMFDLLTHLLVSLLPAAVTASLNGSASARQSAMLTAKSHLDLCKYLLAGFKLRTPLRAVKRHIIEMHCRTSKHRDSIQDNVCHALSGRQASSDA